MLRNPFQDGKTIYTIENLDNINVKGKLINFSYSHHLERNIGILVYFLLGFFRCII